MASAAVNGTGGDHQTDAALHEALHRFKKGISNMHLERFQIGTELKFTCECHLIQRDQENVTALSNLRRVQQFYTRICELEAILKEFCEGDHYISYIWGAMQFLITAATSTWKDGSDGLLNAYERIGKNIPELKDLNPLFAETATSTGLRKCLVAIYSDLLQFHRGAYQCFTEFPEKGRKKIFKSAWKDFEKSDISYLEARMKRHKIIVDYGRQCLLSQQPTVTASFLSQNDIRDLRSKVYDYEIDCNKAEQEHKDKESERRDGQYKEALLWISGGPDTSAELHGTLSKERKGFPGTCDWIKGIESVRNWLTDSTPTHPILWIHGNMGAGKSTLASYIVDTCEERAGDASAEGSFKVTYFYCDGKDPATQSFRSICRGLLRRQLIHIREDEKFRHLIAHCCDRKINSNSSEEFLTADETAEALLKTFFEIIPDQYVIVDGLDECEKPVIKETLKVLGPFVTLQDVMEPGRLRLLIVSREMNEIGKPLSTEPVHADTFKIEVEHNIVAIKLYIKQRLKKFNRKLALNSDKKNYIVNKTSNPARGAQGMFLFAKLTLDYLDRSTSNEDLERRLEDGHFPTDLSEAYDRLLASIKDSLDAGQWNKAKLIFGWLTCTMRTLHWHEIRTIASIERDTESVEIRHHGFVDDVQKFCGTLVHVNEGNKIELIHLTAKKYILESEHVNEQEVKFDLAILCMEYLTFPCFQKGIRESDRKQFAIDGFYAFQDYAVSQWFHHILAVLKIQQVTIDGPKSQKFGEVLVAFMDRYQESVGDVESPLSSDASESSQVNMEGIRKQATEDCASLQEKRFYGILFNLWVSVLKHEKTGTIEDRNKPCLKDIEQVLEDNRKVIEKLAEARGDERPRNLREFYGKNLYKCPRTRCDYFHEGLKDEKKRKKHIDRHTRPFLCPVEDCTMAEAGFISNKDLDRHKKNYHSDMAEGQIPFPSRNTRQSSEAKFSCTHCPKKFTRKINLDGHTRSHFGDRPYSCQTCNRRFARLNDLRRHEKLHQRR